MNIGRDRRKERAERTVRHKRFEVLSGISHYNTRGKGVQRSLRSFSGPGRVPSKHNETIYNFYLHVQVKARDYLLRCLIARSAPRSRMVSLYHPTRG